MGVFFFFALFWSPFILRGQVDKARNAKQSGPAVHVDPNAELLVWLHGLAVAMQVCAMTMGAVWNVRWIYPGQAVVGAVVLVAGWLLATWTLMVFRTWRVKAELAATHELCTDGPFRTIRHPIYTAMWLSAIGTALWHPNPVAIGAAIAMFIGGDLRARSEERLLVKAFGAPYSALMARTKRVIPFVY